jgi:hypothetical protein
MFRVVLPPIIRSAYNCTYSIWYLSHRYCYLPLSWKSWNLFECAVGGVRHPQHTQLDSAPGSNFDINNQICDFSENKQFLPELPLILISKFTRCPRIKCHWEYRGLDIGGQALYMYCVASNEKLPLFPLENLEDTNRLENSLNPYWPAYRTATNTQ